MKQKKGCKEHRQGTIVAIADWIAEITQVQYEDELSEEQKQIKIDQLIREMRNFDITTIGDLYLTTGGRVVLDKGYGEYFTEGDKKLYTLEQLKTGIPYNKFLEKLETAIEDWKTK